jgi:type IX secretion system PorP/SprF family membrane protein
MKRRIPILLTLFVCQWLTVQAQDPIFSQFYAAPLQINPAFAGNTLAPRITLNYRNQWPSFNNAYITYAVSYEQLFERLNSGIGLMVESDNAGDGIYNTTRIGATYAYRLSVSDRFTAKIAAEAGAKQINLDWNRLIFTDQIDPATGPIGPGGVPYPTDELRPENTQKTVLDLAAGVLFFTPRFYAGLSGKHLNAPDISLLDNNDKLNTGLPVRWTLHGGAQIDIQKGDRLHWPVFLSPNAVLIKQGDFGQIDAGAYVGFGPFFAGAWYRHAFENPDAAIGLVGFQKGIFKFGYSFDFTVSELATFSGGGAHEVSLTLNFENSDAFKNRRKARRYEDCFQLFR